MESNYHFEEEFYQIDFTENKTLYGDYENCKFLQCNFNAIDLSHLKFIDCEFIECNLSLVKLNDTSFQKVLFKDSKMIGFNLETCNTFALNISFDTCILNDSSLYQLPLKKTKFSNTTLHNVDFSYADLSNSYFANCDFSNAIFDQTNLRQANLKTSYNFNINPNENQLKGAIFSKDNLEGLVLHLGIKIQ